MYSIDLNTNIAVECQVERVRAIQAYGLPSQSDPARQSRSSEDSSSSRLLAGQWIGVLAVAILIISLVLASSALM